MKRRKVRGQNFRSLRAAGKRVRAGSIWLGLPTVRITGSLDGSTIARGGVGNDNIASARFDHITMQGGYG